MKLLVAMKAIDGQDDGEEPGGIKWAVFLSGKPSEGDHCLAYVTFSGEHRGFRMGRTVFLSVRADVTLVGSETYVGSFFLCV